MATKPRKPKPPALLKSLLDPTFRYVSSAQTDLRKTFARIRREQRKQQQAAGADIAATANVTTLPTTTKRGAA